MFPDILKLPAELRPHAQVPPKDAVLRELCAKMEAPETEVSLVRSARQPPLCTVKCQRTLSTLT